MIRLRHTKIVEDIEMLRNLPEGKVLINTINAHSYNTAQADELFAEALANGDYLIPDGASIVKACKWIDADSKPRHRIAGWDLFVLEMQRQAEKTTSVKPVVMFMGSSERVLSLIRERMAIDYPSLDIVTYSPPYKSEFTPDENADMVSAINSVKPSLLWIGMTAPKQEKWAYSHWNELNINCHCGTIGAVFDFYAGTMKRAPLWWQNHSLEWLYRLLSEPRRMWRRYIIGNTKFLYYMLVEKMKG